MHSRTIPDRCWASSARSIDASLHSRAALQGSGQAASALPNSTVPLKVVGGDNLTQVVASWATTYGVVGNGSLQLGPVLGIGNNSTAASPGAINGGSFAIGATVGIVAAGKLLQHFLPHAMWRCAHYLQQMSARAPLHFHLTCPFLLPHSTAVVAVLAVLGLLIWRRHKKRQLRRKPVPLEQGSPGESKLVSVAPSAVALHGSGGPSSSLSDRQDGCACYALAALLMLSGLNSAPLLAPCKCAGAPTTCPATPSFPTSPAAWHQSSRPAGHPAAARCPSRARGAWAAAAAAAYLGWLSGRWTGATSKWSDRSGVAHMAG